MKERALAPKGQFDEVCLLLASACPLGRAVRGGHLSGCAGLSSRVYFSGGCFYGACDFYHGVPLRGPFIIRRFGTLDRFAVFVDAGYLYAASGALCFGVSDRNKLVLDCKAAAEALAALGASKSELPHLRTYWYDGAKDAQPTAQHLDVAYLPGVKLRLGRLVKGKQKGVDSRIVRDLIILSEERAVSVAYLVGGDEDLREGVSEAQERGVKVVLVGVEPPTTQNLSPTLAMEADDVVVLNKPFVSSFIALREISVPISSIPRFKFRPRGRRALATLSASDSSLRKSQPRSWLCAKGDRASLLSWTVASSGK